MKKETEETNNNWATKFPLDPQHPPSEDIFSKGTKVFNLDPEAPSEMKAPNQKEGTQNEKDFKE